MTNPSKVPTLSGRPLLGNLLEFRSDRIGLQRRIVAEHGDRAWFRIGPVKALMVSSAELAHEVLTEKADAFVKSAGLGTFARPLLGDGLLTSEHETHKRNRRLLAPAFSHRRIAGYATVMSEHTERKAAAWRDGDELDLAEEMMRLTLSIVGRTLFDAEVEDEASAIGSALTIAMEHIIGELTQLVHVPYRWPTPRNRRLAAAVGRLDETVYRMIRQRRRLEVDRGDVLSMLLLARDEDDGTGMSDAQVRDEAMTLLLAGHETTANALAWAGWLLGRHPAVAERLAGEAAAVLSGRAPRFEDLPHLPFAAQVFKESMRLYPPAYLIGRMAEREVTVGGQRLAKGTVVMVNVFGIHHRGDYFARPEEFRPERFEAAAEKALPKSAYLPFGGGPRICIGNHFALMEGQLILAALAQRVRLELVSDAPIDPEPLITLRPRGGVRVRVRRRPLAVTRAIAAG